MLVPSRPGMPEGLGPNPQSYETDYSQSRGWGLHGCLDQFQGGQAGQNQAQRAQVGLTEALPQHCVNVLNLNLFLILRTCFNWILPVSHLKTHPALKLNLFLNLKDTWTMPTFHQQIFSVSNIKRGQSTQPHQPSA